MMQKMMYSAINCHLGTFTDKGKELLTNWLHDIVDTSALHHCSFTIMTQNYIHILCIFPGLDLRLKGQHDHCSCLIMYLAVWHPLFDSIKVIISTIYIPINAPLSGMKITSSLVILMVATTAKDIAWNTPGQSIL